MQTLEWVLDEGSEREIERLKAKHAAEVTAEIAARKAAEGAAADAADAADELRARLGEMEEQVQRRQDGLVAQLERELETEKIGRAHV